jgi:large subunit ribosomal protein L33|tara:strand:+ start:1431 stop:1637 length:207 start_codon:yes stop_codon:yes gene_type:complete
MAKKSSKKSFELKMMVPEDDKQKTGTRYWVKKPTKGEKRQMKLRQRKYDPVLRTHVWFVEKKMPPHSK